MKEEQMQEFSFEPLKAEWKSQAIDVIVAANVDSSPLVTSGFVKPQYFKIQTDDLYEQSLTSQEQANKHLKEETQFNHVLRCNGQIVAVMLSIDYVLYYKMISNQFETNAYYGLYRGITIEDMSIGERVYFSRLSVKPQWMRRGLGVRLFQEMSRYLKEKGYEGSYSGVVSQVSQRIFSKNNGRIVLKKEFKTEFIDFQSKIYYNNFADVVGSVEVAEK